MTLKYRLLASIALAAVASAMVHAQSRGDGYTRSSLQITGVTATYGGYASVAIYTGGYIFDNFGPYHGNHGQYTGGMGHYIFSNYTAAYFNTQDVSAYVTAFGGAYASPDGQVSGGSSARLDLVISNSDKSGVYVSFVARTEAGSLAWQNGTGDSGYGQSESEILVNNHLWQGSFTAATADALFGFGNYTESYSYASGAGFTGGFYYDGFGSPYQSTSDTTEVLAWSLYVPAHSYAVLSMFDQVREDVTSLRPNATPSPAAVAPFALGLLPALRRRR